MNVGSMSITGLVASKINIEGIITQLGQIRRKPVFQLQDLQEQHGQRLVAFQQLIGRTLNLSTNASALTDGSAFSQVTATSSNPGAVVVGASSGAPVGSYDIVVDQLARSHKIASGSVESRTEPLGYEGEIIVNGSVVQIGASDSLAQIRDRLNSAGVGVSASILAVSESDHRLVLTSLVSGADGAMELIDANESGILEAMGLHAGEATAKHQIADGAASDAFSDRLSAAGALLGLTNAPAGTVQIAGTAVQIDLATDSLEQIAATVNQIDGVTATVETVMVDGRAAYRLEITGADGQPAFADDANVLATLGIVTRNFAHEMDAARDAIFSVDGVSMTRSTNAVDDAIENVQLQLTAVTGAETATVRIAANPSAAVDAMRKVVDAYNEVVGLINKHQEFDAEAGKGGLFSGSATIVRFESDLRRCLSGLVNTLGGNLTLASQVGLSFDRADQLVFDSNVFLDALRTDPEGVRRLFGVRTEVSAIGLAVESYTAATADSGPAGYAVHITQAARQATAVSADLSEGIAVAEMLTIDGRSVGLSAGMSLQDAVDRLNLLFTTQRMDMTASIEGGSMVIRHDSYGEREISIASSLDAGMGGTDLGGATAGEAAIYRGQDVEGTINGESATGRGRLLIADRGTDAEGLQLVVSVESPGDAGVVRVSKGLGSQLTDFINRINDSRTGYLTRAADGISQDISAIDDQIAEIEADVSRYIDRLRADFSRMETQMSQSIALLDWMENQIQHLPGWRDRR